MARTQKQRGGRCRATRKASNWAKAVTKVYRQMKKEDPTVQLVDAMKHASALRKQGKL
jgi:hypothetical protein